jgi:hypothetical protein
MTDEYKLEYLEMKTNYLALRNEIQLNENIMEMHGQGIVGNMRRGLKKMVSGPIPVAFEYYSKIFKGKISKDTKKGLDKIHNEIKNKYFEIVPKIEAFEKEVNNHMSSMTLQTCITGKAKKTYDRSAYIVYFLYPYERMAYKAVKAHLINGGGSLDDVRKFTGHVMDAYSILTSQTTEGKNILKWDVFSTKAGVPLKFRKKEHYVKIALQSKGLPIYDEVTMEQQRNQEGERQQMLMEYSSDTSEPVDSSLPPGVNKKNSRFGMRSPFYKKKGGSVDDFWDSSDFSFDGGSINTDLDSSFNMEGGSFINNNTSDSDSSVNLDDSSDFNFL